MVSLVKSLLTALIVAIISAIVIIIAAIVFEVSIPILAIGAITVAGSVVFSYGLDAADKALGRKIINEDNKDGIATYISPQLRQAGTIISKNWQYLKTKYENEYEEFKLWAN